MDTIVFFCATKPGGGMPQLKFDRQLSRPEKEAFINDGVVCIVERTETHAYYEVFRSPCSGNHLPQLRTVITRRNGGFLCALNQPGWPPAGCHEFGLVLEWDEFNQQLRKLGFIQ